MIYVKTEAYTNVSSSIGDGKHCPVSKVLV